VASVVVPLPRSRTVTRVDLSGLLPSTRSLLACLAAVAIGLSSFFVARNTGAFAVRTIAVEGAPPAVERQVRAVLADQAGVSLLRLDRGAVRRRVESVPAVAGVTLDRAFPHTLRLVVVPEEPVAVVRQGAKAWLLSARGRIVQSVDPRARRGMTRVWIPRTTHVTVGGFLPANHATAVARALALAGTFPAHIVRASLRIDGLRFVLRNGLELRLGDPTDIRLKLAIARRMLHVVHADSSSTGYLDVSVPDRPVAGAATLDSPVEVETSTSSGA